MQKQEIFLFEGYRSIFCIKVPFGIGHPPPTHQMQSICVWEGSWVPNLQMEFNYLDLFKSYCIFHDFVVPTWSLSSSCHPYHPHHLQKVPMSPHLLSLLSPPHVVPTPPWSPHCPHVIPIVPTSSPHCLEDPYIIPTPPIATRPTPHPPEGWGPGISKDSIRFELIEIFQFCLKI